MLSLNNALAVVKKNYPDGKIQKYIDYKNFYVFMIFGNDELEGQFDPFFSVDKNTGEFSDFSIITDGDPKELTDLFLKARDL